MSATHEKCRHGLGPGCSECDLDPQPAPPSRKRPIMFEQEKHALRELAEASLTGLKVGDSATFTLPAEQPMRGSLYQVITNVAVRMFGRGNFQVKTEHPKVLVIRKKAS